MAGHCQIILLSPFPYCSFWKEVSMCSPCLRSGDLCCFFLRMEYLHKLFGILLYGRFLFSPIYVFIIYLYKYGLLHIHIILWDIIQCYFIYFVAQTIPALSTGGWGGLSVGFHHCGHLGFSVTRAINFYLV